MADIVCPSCSTQYRINDSQLAKASKLRCKKCGTIFQLQENIKVGPPSQEPEGPTLPEGIGQFSQQTTELETMEFDLSNIQLNYSQSEPAGSEEATITHSGQASQGERSLGSDREKTSLDFETSLDFSFTTPVLDRGVPFPEAEDTEDIDSRKIHDHITVPSQVGIARGGTDFSKFSFAPMSAGAEHKPSETPPPDFSLSAATSETPPEGDEWDDENGADILPSQEAPNESDMGLSLGEVQFEQEDAESASGLDSGEEEAEPPSSAPPSTEEDDDDFFENDEDFVEEELSTCCVDSLAMGLKWCELCGRDLSGRDQAFVQDLQQERRQQLKGELIAGDVQVGFSGDVNEIQPQPHIHSNEDFSDVEQALDALADGTFQHKIKKRQAKKTFVKQLKLAVGGLVALLAVAGLVQVFLLPSSHEKLQARYEELRSQEDVDAGQLVQLFFDAVIKQDMDIFSRLTILPTMPEIAYGRVINVGEEYEKNSLGMLGKNLIDLEQTIIDIEQENADKTALLQEYSAKNLSPGIIEDRIEQNEKKLAALEKEFDEKNEALSRKLNRLQQKLQKTKQEIVENRSTSRKYIDATDTVGKALYENSVTKQKYLTEQQGKLQLQVQQEDAKYQTLRQELEEEYQPQFSKLKERLKNEKALYREAVLLKDKEHSPVVVLTKELAQLTQTLITKKEELEDAKRQLNSALAFFAPNERSHIRKEQEKTEFLHVSKNVAASIKIGDGREEQASIVLKQYQAILPDKTLTGEWLVEKLAQ